MYIKSLLSVFVLSLFFSACGGGDASSIPPNDPETKVGYLIDSAVEGVEYTTSSGKSATTDSSGKFEYLTTDTNISFSIGGLKLPSFNLSNIKSDNKILPADLVGVDRNNTTNTTVVKILQLFQSLDSDGNPNNGITITQNIKNSIATSKNIIDINDTELETLVQNTGKTFMDKSQAITHYKTTLQNDFNISFVEDNTSQGETNTSDTTPPQFTSSNSATVAENQTDAIDIDATDTNSSVVYSLSGVDKSSFSINTATGMIEFKVAPDYETKTTYNFIAIATDESNNSAEQNITITITDIADVVPTIENFTTTIDENTTIGTNIGQITITESGDSAITSFTLSDTTNFEVNSTGAIKTKTIFDFESGTTTYNITVKATNSAGDSVSKNVDINIADVVEPTTQLYIKSAIYDTNRTSTPDDDKLYLYFNKDIKPSSISVDSSANYDINGTGAIGSNSLSEYNSSLFYRHKLSLNSDGTASIKFDTNGSTKIYLKNNQITDTNDNLPQDFNQTEVKKFNVFARLQTGQITTYVEYDDGNTTRGIARSFTNNADDTVTDNATGLMWQDEAYTSAEATAYSNNTEEGKALHWATAITYCENLSLAGYDDWYLPSIDELVSITDKGRYNPSINSAFNNVVSSDYWSSTTNASFTSYAWTVYFYGGGDYDSSKTNTYYVRCVREQDN
jgi:hypothetical protein